jgi:hypothetical protein
MIFRYIAYWPLNVFLVCTAWGISSPILIAILAYFGVGMSVRLWTLPLLLFSAPSLAGLSLVTGPKLPGLLQWFSTLNADLDGGWRQKVDGFRDPATLNTFQLWWQRTRWTWRNPCNGWQSELLGVSDISKAFSVKREVPLLFGFFVKWWAGWNPNKRGGNFYPYAFQCGLKRR